VNTCRKTFLIPLYTVILFSLPYADPDPNFHCYLLFGQSNMAGGGAGVSIGGSGSGTLIAADCDTSPRVKVLAFCDCSAGSGAACTQYKKSRTADTWYTAYPALHSCDEGISPGDYFGKTMLDSVSDDISIGLIPCALSGQALNVFEKGGSNFNLPTWAHPTLGNKSPYTWMLERCKLAQKTGVIKGILLHQGESGSGGGSWVTMAGGIIDNLKKDLGLPDTLPVVVGELRADNYKDFNTNNVDKFAQLYPHCGVASSAGLSVQSDDQWHFNAAGMRELGKRFANELLKLSPEDYIPRKGTTAAAPRPVRTVSANALGTLQEEITMYTLQGRERVIRTSGHNASAVEAIRPGNVYIISRKGRAAAEIMVHP